jgi:hypothetical protein
VNLCSRLWSPRSAARTPSGAKPVVSASCAYSGWAAKLRA